MGTAFWKSARLRMVAKAWARPKDGISGPRQPYLAADLFLHGHAKSRFCVEKRDHLARVTVFSKSQGITLPSCFSCTCYPDHGMSYVIISMPWSEQGSRLCKRECGQNASTMVRGVGDASFRCGTTRPSIAGASRARLRPMRPPRAGRGLRVALFWNSQQGSRIIPYAWFLKLEQHGLHQPLCGPGAFGGIRVSGGW